jgi:hypothetical protein
VNDFKFYEYWGNHRKWLKKNKIFNDKFVEEVKYQSIIYQYDLKNLITNFLVES